VSVTNVCVEEFINWLAVAQEKQAVITPVLPAIHVNFVLFAPLVNIVIFEGKARLFPNNRLLAIVIRIFLFKKFACRATPLLE
jgi:hypothetical protein